MTSYPILVSQHLLKSLKFQHQILKITLKSGTKRIFFISNIGFAMTNVGLSYGSQNDFAQSLTQYGNVDLFNQNKPGKLNLFSYIIIEKILLYSNISLMARLRFCLFSLFIKHTCLSSSPTCLVNTYPEQR
jgi:hypothetical protein